MPCYHPIDAWRKNGGGITFNMRDGFIDRPVTIACGQCIGCRLERSRQWAVRCMHEASLHEDNCFITLTYSDEYLPRAIDVETGEIGAGVLPSLNKRDMQLFMKRLRKEFSHVKIRFLQCGEYGSQTGRPHHHALLFCFDFPDKYLFARNQRLGVNYYRSPILEKLWPFGLCAIGDLTFESAAYVARYCVKKFSNKDSDKVNAHYQGRVPEYITMSLKPGIAHDWIKINLDDFYPNDRIFVRAGKTSRPPKYYDKIYDLEKKDFWRIRCNRMLKAESRPKQSVRRLIDREVCAQLKAAKLVRNMN